MSIGLIDAGDSNALLALLSPKFYDLGPNFTNRSSKICKSRLRLRLRPGALEGQVLEWSLLSNIFKSCWSPPLVAELEVKEGSP